MSFVAALLPVVIYIYIVYQIDNFSLMSVKRLILLILSGMLTALACFGLFQLTEPILSESQSDSINPIIEEMVKAIPLLFLAARKKMVFFIDSVISGAAVGGGFSILENLFYLLLGDELGVGTVLFRGLEVALVHMGCSAIVAAGLMLAVRMIERSRSRLGIKKSDVAMSVFLLFEAPVLHVFHNTFHFSPLVQFIFVLGTLGGLLMWTYYYDVDMIHRWIDKGLERSAGQYHNRQVLVICQREISARGLFRHYLLCATACGVICGCQEPGDGSGIWSGERPSFDG